MLIKGNKPIWTRWAGTMFSALFWLGLWQVAYEAVGQDLLLASPVQVGRQIWAILGDGASWRAMGNSLMRTLLAYGLGIMAGCVLAILTSAVPLMDALFRPALGAIRATPVASFIILALVWLRSDKVPILTGFLMVLPVVWANVSQGIASTDPQLLEMAKVFGFGPWRTARAVYYPSARGPLMAACTTSIGLCWKAMIAAEVLGVPRNAMGTRLYNAKVYLETDKLLAWTLLIVLLSMGLEKLLKLWLARREARP